jgi:hypothetical protein
MARAPLLRRNSYAGAATCFATLFSSRWLLLAAFALLGFFAVPPIAKYYLVKTLSEQLERPVAVQEIRFNPFTLRAQVKGFSVQEKRSSQIFVSFDELLVNLEYRSLIRLAPVLKQMMLTRPYLHIVRNPDAAPTISRTWWISSPSPHLRSKAKAPAFLAQQHFVERRAHRLRRSPQPRQARDDRDGRGDSFISNLPDVVDVFVQPAFAAHIDGAPFVLKGRTKPFKDTLETSLDLNVEHLDLPRYVEYLPLKLGFQLASARSIRG